MSNPTLGLDMGIFGALEHAETVSKQGFVRLVFDTGVEIVIPRDDFDDYQFKDEIILDADIS